ncbi:hypothetical protein WA026_005933 [Henosepilachna vigintioctopunctata]|uniref:Condensin-2 complex subunit H2 C-terminal domain-containing protein n=1 Tax=Henosepilachna vigintioctopunctata TaxID=420089 RepID=A0AAW1TUD2_9CUCU
MNEFQYLNSERDSRLFSGWHKKMVVDWDLQPISKECRSFAEKCSHFRTTNNTIYDRDHDDEFVVHTSNLESAIALEELFLQQKPSFERFSFEIYTSLYLVPNFLQYHQLKYEELEKYSDKFENLVGSYRDRLLEVTNRGTKSMKPSSPELRQTVQKLRRISITSTIVSKLSRADFDKVYSQECQENSAVTTDVDNTSCTPNLTAIQDGDVHCIEDVASSTVLESIPNLTDNIDDNSDLAVNESLDSNNINLNKGSEYVSVVPEEKCRVSRRKREILQEVKHFLNDTEDIIHGDSTPRKRRKLSIAALKKLATGITVDLKEFSLFFAANYNAEEGEGQVDIPEFHVDDPIDSSSRIDPDEDMPLSQRTENRLCTQDSGYESRLHEDEDEELELQSPATPFIAIDSDGVQEIPNEPDTPSHEPDAPSEDCHEPDAGSLEIGNGIPDEEKPLHEKVYEWKQHMSEILKERSSKDFDIHEYGSNIMQCLDTDHPKKFGEIVRGKSSAEVTRYFISALQLANTSNVEIVGVQSGKLSNETFGLKLITSDCYYERLKTYVAPSEESYCERLQSARKLNQRREYHAGSSMGHKRAKYE